MTTNALHPGSYVRTTPDADPQYGPSEVGVVRDVSADGRIVFVQFAGDESPSRFSPDELLVA